MKVFISHSSEDRAKFDDLSFAFEHEAISLWHVEEITAGETLRETLRTAIEECAICVFIATRNSLASGWCQAEIGAFWGAGKPVIVYLSDPTLKPDELPKQFQPDKWALSTREVVHAVRQRLRKATEPALASKCPANVFWLGHDLARAIRFAKWEYNNRSELDLNLRQALHHLEELRLPAPEVRTLLLNALKAYRSDEKLSEEQVEQFVVDIAKAKNEVGDLIAKLQPQFRGYPTLEAQDRLNREVQEL